MPAKIKETQEIKGNKWIKAISDIKASQAIQEMRGIQGIQDTPVINKTINNKPMKVLVTRPLHLAKPITEKLIQAGFTPELFPTIEFQPTSNLKELRRAVQQLSHTDIAIFVSKAAVQYGMEAIRKVWQKNPPNILYAAIGPATQKSLQSHGLQQVICPLMAPYESETLLAHPELQSVQNKNIVIFRGNGGRNLLAKTLKERGANLAMVECYQRIMPRHNIAPQLNSWKEDPFQMSVATSAKVLENLRVLVGREGWQDIQMKPMIVVGLRMQVLAATLGITQVIVAQDADDASIMEALLLFRDRKQNQ